MENLTQNGHNQGLFSKIRALYSIFMGMGSPLFFSIVTLLWVWLKLHKNPWIYLDIPENVWINCFDYARALDMHDHLKYSTGFLRYLGLLKYQGSEYGTVVYGRVTQNSEYTWLWLHMPQCCLNTPQYVLISLNMPEHCWMSLNVLKCLNELFWWIL